MFELGLVGPNIVDGPYDLGRIEEKDNLVDPVRGEAHRGHMGHNLRATVFLDIGDKVFAGVHVLLDLVLPSRYDAHSKVHDRLAIRCRPKPRIRALDRRTIVGIGPGPSPRGGAVIIRVPNRPQK